MSNLKTVEVTVKLPKAIVDFLEGMGIDVEEYIIYNVVGCVHADLDDMAFARRRLAEKYDMKSAFESCGYKIEEYWKPL